MNYALVENNEVIHTRLPKVGVLPDGRSVSGFDKLPQEVLKTAGWYPIQENTPPDYDPNTQSLNKTYALVGETVVESYTIITNPEPEPVVPGDFELLENARDAVARMVVADRVVADTIDNNTAEIVAPLFPELSLDGMAVAVDDIYRWNGTLVRVIQAHTTQTDWVPETTPALFKVYRDISSSAQPWAQPAGAHDAYVSGATVTHNGSTWLNTHGDGNVWEPGVYGWIQQ